MLKSFSRKSLNRFHHLISPSVQYTLQSHFLQFFQIKHSTFPVGFLSLMPQHHHLILTPRPITRLQMSFEK